MEHGHNNLKILAIILGPLLDGAAYATISLHNYQPRTVLATLSVYHRRSVKDTRLPSQNIWE
jgi:hypothetical protein